jgi:glycosyltransferase involved in cell wall biosynthesis
VRTSFITWYPHCRRSDTIAAALGASSHLIHYLGFRRPLHAPVKYVLQTVATLRILRRERPDVVLVAAPPIFAALPVLLYAWIAQDTRVVIDAHTGVFAHRRWSWLLPLTRAVFRQADAVIVTGGHLAHMVRSWGARAVVIGTVPVVFGPGRSPHPCNGPRVVVVNSFAVDEPLDELLQAAARLNQVCFFVTGDTALARREWLEGRPENLSFTGFVSEQEYAGLLRAADAVVVLTTHDHTMQRGGYEAMALGKPLVTSDWPLLRETFSRGTVHVRPVAAEIVAGIARALESRHSLSGQMITLREEHEREFQSRLAELKEAVGFVEPARASSVLPATAV